MGAFGEERNKFLDEFHGALPQQEDRHNPHGARRLDRLFVNWFIGKFVAGEETLDTIAKSLSKAREDLKLHDWRKYSRSTMESWNRHHQIGVYEMVVKSWKEVISWDVEEGILARESANDRNAGGLENKWKNGNRLLARATWKEDK